MTKLEDGGAALELSSDERAARYELKKQIGVVDGWGILPKWNNAPKRTAPERDRST